MILYYLLVFSLPLLAYPAFAAKFGGLTVEKGLGGLAFLYAVAEMVGRRRVPLILETGQGKSFFVFFMLSGISFLRFGVSDPSNNFFLIYASHLMFLVTTVILVNSLSRLRWTLLAVVISIGWTAQYVIRDWRYGASAYGWQYRPGSVAGGPNVFTASALIALSIAFHFYRSERRDRWERLLCMGCLLLGLLAIMVAASRGGLVGLVATTFFILFRSRRRARNLIGAGLALALLLLVLPSSPLHRALHPAASDTRSTQLHLLVWQAGLRMVRAHPIGGVGLGNFKAVVANYADPSLNINLIAHDTYIEMAAELGLPGLLAYLAILFFAFRSLGQTRREARKAGQSLIFQAASGLQAGLVGFCVTQLFVSAEFLKLFWLAVFISACLPWLLACAKGLQKSSAKEAALLSRPAGQLA